ncbi:DUF7289 family protein [Haloarchaeobius sp. TZWWS8]|uniref:DUF7289 family protein n=1 Tax=Haloarchaeobius sp. TZWWS8 TaxID=3446121 RepID=UPI003EB7B39B
MNRLPEKGGDSSRAWGGRRRVQDARGVTPLLAVVLLVGIVTVGTVSIVMLGGMALERQTDKATDERVERSFVALGKDVNSVALGQGSNERIDFDTATSEGSIQRENTGHIEVYTENVDIANESFGSIEYRRGETVYAYQAGGIWRGTGANAVMVSSPQFRYQDGTLNLPIPILSGDERFDNGVVTLKKRSTKAPLNEVGYVKGELVTVEIQSEYYGGWAQYFREQTSDMAVSVDEANETVIVKLGRPIVNGRFAQGVFATGGDDGDIVVRNGNAQIDGPVRAEGDIDVDGAGVITGPQIPNLESGLYELDPAIELKVEAARNNSSLPSVNPAYNTLGNGSTYYIDEDIDLSSNDVKVDLADGNVTLILNGSISLDGADIDIRNPTDDHVFRVYTNGNFGMRNGQAGIAGDASRLQIYGTSDMQVAITGGGGSTKFYGTIYAPRDEPAVGEDEPNEAALSSESSCEGWDVCIVSGSAYVEGAIIGGPTNVEQSAELVYDPALETVEPSLELEDGLFPPPITFLHVSLHEVSAENDERIVVRDATVGY